MRHPTQLGALSLAAARRLAAVAADDVTHERMRVEVQRMGRRRLDMLAGHCPDFARKP